MKVERIAVCGECKEVLHSEGMEDFETHTRKRWTKIVMSLPLANMQCPNKCYGSGSDHNANVDVKFRLPNQKKILDFTDIKNMINKLGIKGGVSSNEHNN